MELAHLWGESTEYQGESPSICSFTKCLYKKYKFVVQMKILMWDFFKLFNKN